MGQRVQLGRGGEEYSAVARIVEALKKEVINGTLSPDALIVESQVGKRFGVSKTPAREALVRLSGMGFVNVIPGKGYTVTKLSWQQLKDLFEVRLLLESSAIEMAAARATAEEIAALHDAAALPRRQSLSIEQLLDANLQFHSVIWRAARNERLARMASQTMDDLMRAMHTAMLSENAELMVENHVQLSELIAQKKANKARETMAKHVDATRRRILGI